MTAKSICKFSKTIKLAADTAKHLFVEVDGSLPSAGAYALGTTERAGKENEHVGVLVLGQGVAVAAAAVAAGALLMVDGNGKALTQTSGKIAVGRALTAATAKDDEFEYIAIPN